MANYMIARFDEIHAVKCPCGFSRRAFVDPENPKATMHVVDVHPPSKGKAEGLRFLEEAYGIPAERVVAIGDAGNDVEMLRAAGLGVAMGQAQEPVQRLADRVIGDHDSDAIAELVEELFEL